MAGINLRGNPFEGALQVKIGVSGIDDNLAIDVSHRGPNYYTRKVLPKVLPTPEGCLITGCNDPLDGLGVLSTEDSIIGLETELCKSSSCPGFRGCLLQTASRAFGLGLRRGYGSYATRLNFAVAYPLRQDDTRPSTTFNVKWAGQCFDVETSNSDCEIANSSAYYVVGEGFRGGAWLVGEEGPAGFRTADICPNCPGKVICPPFVGTQAYEAGIAAGICLNRGSFY